MQVAVLVTGGKDSALALYRALEKNYEVKYLITMRPQRADSWMFHYPNIYLADLFAEAVGIPLIKGETSGVKEFELEDLRRLLSRLDVGAIVSGAISSQYQKERIDGISESLGLKHIAPLWHEEPIRILEEIIASKIEAVIVGVYAYGLNETWLGRRIDKEAVKDLIELNRKFEVSVVGEGGEYETLVLDAPFFSKIIELVETQKMWAGESGSLLVKKAALIDKKEGKRRDVYFS